MINSSKVSEITFAPTNISSVSGNSSSVSNNISIGNNDELIKKLCATLQITVEEYNEIIIARPDFVSITDFDEQKKIIADYKSGVLTTESFEDIDSESSDIDVDEWRQQFRAEESADKLDYNKQTTVKDKFEACIRAAAKGTYINGVKDSEGNVKDEHDENEWDELCKNGQDAKYIENFKANLISYINKDENLKSFLGILDSKLDAKEQERVLDAFMRKIQAANNHGVSISDFMQLSENEQLDAIEGVFREYPETMNDNDLEYQQAWNNIISSVQSRLKEQHEISEDIDLCPSDARQRIEFDNLNSEELLYQALQRKVDNKMHLSATEQQQYNSLNELFSCDAGKAQIDKSKAVKLARLEEKYNQLKTENNPDNKWMLDWLEKTINSEESNRLRNIPIPQVKTDLDRRVVADIEQFNKDTPLNGTNDEIATLIGNIELNCKDMTPKEKQDYIATFIKFYHGSASAKLFSLYAKEYPNFYKRDDIVDVASLDTVGMSDENFKDFCETKLRVANAKDETSRSLGRIAASASSQILASSQCAGSEFDNKKVCNSIYHSQINDANILILTTNTNTTIRDANKADEAQGYITDSEFATDATHIHTVNVAKKFVPGAQAKVMNRATSKSAAATAYVAENDLIQGLAKEAQTEAFVGTHESINKHFEDEDAVKYSNALADQIQNCDKDNQLAMHNEIMGSKYSEVQEHAAGNIKNYDPSVQPDAMSSVYRTGNQKAIETAIASIPEFKSPDVQQIVLKQAVMELVDKEAFADILAKLGGTLTSEQIAQLSPSERREYFTKLFDKANFSDQVAMLKNILHGNSGIKSKVTVYNLIGKFYPNLFEELVKDSGVAEKVYNMQGLDPKLKNKTAAAIVNSFDSSMKALAQKLHLTNDYDYPQTAKTVNYSSVPYGFADDKFNFFAKDKHVNLLA